MERYFKVQTPYYSQKLYFETYLEGIDFNGISLCKIKNTLYTSIEKADKDIERLIEGYQNSRYFKERGSYYGTLTPAYFRFREVTEKWELEGWESEDEYLNALAYWG